jgi:uncharacterized protein with FMN-binding domain
MFRTALFVLTAVSLPLSLAGCGSKADMEKQVKEGMEQQLNIKVTSLSLTKVSDDKYTGTAEATNGIKYDLLVKVKGSKFEWRAIPDRSTLEKTVKQRMEEKLKIQVKSLSLTKMSDDKYTGTAEAAVGGVKYNVTVTIQGKNMYIQWMVQPAAAPAK